MLYQLSYLPESESKGRSHAVRVKSLDVRLHTVPTPAPTPPAAPLLEVQDLRVEFPVRSGLLRRVTGVAKAVDGVSFHINRGETLGLVGESGCGKTTVGRAVLRLIQPAGGSVRFDGQDVGALGASSLRALRRRMQIVFQDPAGALNPRMRIGDIVAEPLRVHRLAASRREAHARAAELLTRCGLPDPTGRILARYPHEFSGGQRQRIVIARALATSPELIVCDEPTSALDVSVQAQILNLIRDLQRDLGLSLLFISHDMGVVGHMCDRIAVMRAGQIVETGQAQRVIRNPEQDYTRTLLAAVPGRSARNNLRL